MRTLVGKRRLPMDDRMIDFGSMRELRKCQLIFSEDYNIRSRWLIRRDNRAGGSEHAADAVADRDLVAGDLGGGGGEPLAYALLQRVHPVHSGMHVRKITAIGVEWNPQEVLGLWEREVGSITDDFWAPSQSKTWNFNL
jgi:hypothetical protein